MNQTNLSPLRIYDSLAEQNHRREWIFDKVTPLISPIGVVPPFQFVKSQTGNGITNVLLVRFSDGVKSNITGDMNNSGLSLHSYTAFDIVEYLGTISLPTFGSQEGYYYLELSVDGTTKYSEVFGWALDTSDMIRIEYWHNKNLTFKDGLLRYTYPFKHRIFIPAAIARPTYPYNERINNRRGRNFAREQISSKLYRFSFLAPEYLIDAVRGIRLHNNVEIYYQGQTYDVDEFLMTDPEWLDQSDLATVVCEFQTDTIVINDAEGTEGIAYTAEDGACLVATHTALGYIVENSQNWDNGVYDDRDGVGQQMTGGEKVVIEYASGIIGLATYTAGGSYTVVLMSEGETVYEQAGDRYWLRTTTTLVNGPVIETAVGGVVTGLSFPNSYIEVYVQENGRWVKTGQGTSAELEGAGISFQDLGSNYVRLVASTIACPRRWESPMFLITEQAWQDPDGNNWQTPGGENWIWTD